MGKQYTRESAIRKITSKGGRIEVPTSTPNGNSIKGKIDMSNADTGNGTWGAVDYLTRQHGGFMVTGYPGDNQGKANHPPHRTRDGRRESMEMIEA